MLVRVRQGKGGNDRVVPLAPRGLELLRAYWQRQRPRPWLFPARDPRMPLPATTLQQTCTRVVRQSGLATAASSHPLRPASATHVWARGVSLRVMQARLGHQSPRTTARYPHLTPPTWAVVHATIATLMADRSTHWSLGMPAVADVLRRDGADERQRFGEALRPSHRRASDAMLRCRTEAVGGQVWPCDHWGQAPSVYHACRHRRCPHCHQQDTEAWRAERRQALLPVPYLHVGGTVPHERGEILRQHQTDLDDILLRAAAQSRIKLAADAPDVGGLIGGLGVLHTWTRTLAYQPHGHCLVPAGGVSADRTEWRPARTAYLVPFQALSKRFRGLFLDLVRQERPDLTLPESVWTKGGVVSGKPALQGTEQVLNDLGR